MPIGAPLTGARTAPHPCVVTIWDLKPGVRVRVEEAFVDFDGRRVLPGERGVLAHDVFSYDDGHTFQFEGGEVVRLSGNLPENARVLYDAVATYWTIVDAPR